MQNSPRRLPASSSLEQLRKQAKDLLRLYRSGDSAVTERFRAVIPVTGAAGLAAAQFVLAREYGFESWAKLKQYMEAKQAAGQEEFERLAQELATAYMTGDATQVREINWSRGTSFGWDHNPVRMQEKLGTWFESEKRAPELALADAQRMVARAYGSDSWSGLMQRVTQGPAGSNSAPHLAASSQPDYRMDAQENTIEPGPVLFDQDWDGVFAVMKERGITGLDAGGRMTDGALARLCRLDHLTRLKLGGSVQLTDAGLAHLAGLPRLQELDLSGWKGRITDRGLEVLRRLPELRRLQMCWQQNISDQGAANLASCEQLESVDLLGTPTGDGAVAALTGKRNLSRLKTGLSVTDAGLALLHRFPMFRTWRGGRLSYGLMSADAGPTQLLIDGPFTDAGLAGLAELDGLFALSFFWHCDKFTSSGLAPLEHLPNLGFLGIDGKRCDDEAMQRIASIPGLRMLMAQGTVASDTGFAALCRSQSLEYIWGRECPNLTGRGFAALASMPSLRGLAVSCRNVDDAALSMLPRFPALRELMPMDVADEGFRHVGECKNLEALWCMYCRDTGDLATGHIAGLSSLRKYYAGASRITDRSLELLGRMTSLERLEFWQCMGITDTGIAHLAGLPRLKEIILDGLPGVTRLAASLFPAGVRVSYSA